MRTKSSVRVGAVAASLLMTLFGASKMTAQTYTYKTVDGAPIKADVHQPSPPKEGELRPAVMYVHGGALIFGGRDPDERIFSRLLKAGFVVVSIDYRLAPETKLPQIIEDVQDAWKWLQKSGKQMHIDPARIAVAGGSAGGYLTLMSGFCLEPRPRALVSYYGYGDITTPWYSEPYEFYRKVIPLIPKSQAMQALTYLTRGVEGKTISIRSEGMGKAPMPGMLRMLTGSTDWVPPISEDSDGCLGICVDTAGLKAFNEWIGSKPPGNGRMFLGGTGRLAAAKLAPGAGKVYRLWGCPWSGNWVNPMGGWLWLDVPDSTRGVLTGDNAVEVGVPYRLSNRWTGDAFGYNGQVMASDCNDYTGLTTVHVCAAFCGQAGPRGGGSPFGSAAGEVRLKGGQLALYAPSAAAVAPVRKGLLKIDGGCVLREMSAGGGVADLTFGKLQRNNHATLVIYMEKGTLGSDSNRIRFANSAPVLADDNAPVPADGVIAPWMVGTDGFLTYDAKTGLAGAAFTHKVVDGAFPKGLTGGKAVVDISTAACTLGDKPVINALAYNVDVSSGEGDTITLAGGGLIQKTPNTVFKPNLVFGTGPDALVEACIYRPDNGWWGCAEISGKITAAGLTKFGRGFTRLTNAANDIRGPVVCNEGVLAVNNGPGTIGPKNDVILNGGGFTADGKEFPNTFRIGGGGGYLESIRISGPVVDLEPGDSGPLRIYSAFFAGKNTWTGGIILAGQEVRFENADSLPANCPILCKAGTVYFQGSDKKKGIDNARLTLATNQAKLVLAGTLCLGSLEGLGGVMFDGGEATLEAGSDKTDVELHGNMSEDPRTTGHWTKIGAGTLTYWGAAAHSGNTRIEGGTLIVNGSISRSKGVMVLAGGMLGGLGEIACAVEVRGGTIAPGHNGQGAFRLGSALVLDAKSTLAITLPATAKDAGATLKVARGATLAGALRVVEPPGFEAKAGQEWTVAVAGEGFKGEFASLPPGYTAKVVGNNLVLRRREATATAGPAPKVVEKVIVVGGGLMEIAISAPSENATPSDRPAFYVYCRQNGIWPKEVTGHDPKTEPRWFDPYCPVRNVTAKYPPTWMIHGTNDKDVPYEESKSMAAKLKEAGVEHKFITVPGAGHGLEGVKPEDQDRYADEAVEFLKTHTR